MLTIRTGTPDDIPVIMAAERGPAGAGYEAVVGQWSADEHAAAMARDGHVYLIGEAPNPVGFCYFWGLSDEWGNAYLKRIAVLEPGKGHGRAMLALARDWVFTDWPDVYRLWFQVIDRNVRARRVYDALGFIEEGRARGAMSHPDGVRGDFVHMSMLRPEWEGLRTASAG